MTGWGKNLEGSLKLKTASLNIIPSKECDAAYKLKTIYRIREDYHICAGKVKTNTTGCHGDSGG
jgi:hypothetical protein